MKVTNLLFFLFLSVFLSFSMKAQHTTIIGLPIMGSDSAATLSDNLIITIEDEEELSRIADLRTVFKENNRNYSVPRPPGKNLLRFLKKDELKMSEEALYWVNYERNVDTRFDEYITFKDTILVNPLFLPVIFTKKRFTDKEFTFYNIDTVFAPKREFLRFESEETEIFKKYRQQKEMEKLAYDYLERNHPSYFNYSYQQLPQELVRVQPIRKSTYDDLPQLRVESEADFSDVEPQRFIPERRYWRSGFESAIQFSQNHVSGNWHKGGSSNLNLFSKNVVRYNYAKEKFTLNNELEHRTSIYNAPKDTIHEYKVGDDLLRVRSELGLKAFEKWNYSFIAEIKTQVFSNYQENAQTKLAAFLAPISTKLDLGMQYKLEKRYSRHKRLALTASPSPVSYTYMYSSLTDNIDLGRHGFKKNKDETFYNNRQSLFGSALNVVMSLRFNRNTNLESRLDYSTTYDRVICEFENTLILQINRFFSTRINMQVRFDDGIEKKENDRYLQTYELLSFGFNYKW